MAPIKKKVMKIRLAFLKLLRLDGRTDGQTGMAKLMFVNSRPGNAMLCQPASNG